MPVANLQSYGVVALRVQSRVAPQQAGALEASVGGWIQRELDTFVERGFQPVSLGTPILRVEAAVATGLAQLMLLDRIARRA